MILTEEISKETLKFILDDIQSKFNSNNFEFDTTKDGINYWCINDKEKTVFFQEGESYATVSKNDIDNEKEQDIIESLKYQLENT